MSEYQYYEFPGSSGDPSRSSTRPRCRVLMPRLQSSGSRNSSSRIRWSLRTWLLGVRLGHPWLADAAVAACISVTIWAAWSSQPVSSAAVGASS